MRTYKALPSGRILSVNESQHEIITNNTKLFDERILQYQNDTSHPNFGMFTFDDDHYDLVNEVLSYKIYYVEYDVKVKITKRGFIVAPNIPMAEQLLENGKVHPTNSEVLNTTELSKQYTRIYESSPEDYLR